MEQEVNMNVEIPPQLPTTASTPFGACDSLQQPFYTVRADRCAFRMIDSGPISCLNRPTK